MPRALLPAARRLCNSPRTGFPGHFLAVFLCACACLPFSATTRPVIQRPTRLGGCRLCLSSCQLVCPALEVPPRQRIPGTVVPCFRPNVLGLLHSFLHLNVILSLKSLGLHTTPDCKRLDYGPKQSIQPRRKRRRPHLRKR